MSNIFPTDSSAYSSSEFHGEDQADLGRFFLPEIEPEAAVGWPEHAGSGLSEALLTDLEEGDDRTAYEAEFERQTAAYDDYMDLLGNEFGTTHDSISEWEV